LGNVDKIIWVLPVLALLDAISTLRLESLGYPLSQYEKGFFATFFVNAGLIYAYLYAVLYVLLVVGISYVLWYIKKKLDRSNTVDKGIFLALVGVTCYIYVRLTEALSINFFLPAILDRGIGLLWLTAFIYVSCVISLSFYLWSDVLAWVRSNSEQKW
jgi:hypothetical protein